MKEYAETMGTRINEVVIPAQRLQGESPTVRAQEVTTWDAVERIVIEARLAAQEDVRSLTQSPNPYLNPEAKEQDVKCAVWSITYTRYTLEHEVRDLHSSLQRVLEDMDM